MCVIFFKPAAWQTAERGSGSRKLCKYKLEKRVFLVRERQKVHAAGLNTPACSRAGHDPQLHKPQINVGLSYFSQLDIQS